MLPDSMLAELVALAREEGALDAVRLAAGDVIVDDRVALKCQVPLCPNYGVNLMCPPNTPSVAQFAKALSRYRQAILVQVAIDLPEQAQAPGDADLQEACARRPYEQPLVTASRHLARIVHRVESKALGLGCHFAAGFTAGSCRLCDDCVTVQSRERCRLPFRARPAMEAVGIDVVATAARAGVSVSFGDPSKARWTGLILID